MNSEYTLPPSVPAYLPGPFIIPSFFFILLCADIADGDGNTLVCNTVRRSATVLGEPPELVFWSKSS